MSKGSNPKMVTTSTSAEPSEFIVLTLAKHSV